MRKLFITLSALVVVLASCSQKKDYPYKGVSFEKVHFTDGLLAERMDVVRENTIPFAFRKCEETGRIVKADDRVKQVEGRIAVERGPLVYCTVLPEEDSQDIRSIGISADDRFEEHEKTAGIVTLTDTDRNIDYIPYYRHAQDVPTQMSVWVNANR